MMAFAFSKMIFFLAAAVEFVIGMWVLLPTVKVGIDTRSPHLFWDANATDGSVHWPKMVN